MLQCHEHVGQSNIKRIVLSGSKDTERVDSEEELFN
jgi:hypothetical protein